MRLELEGIQPTFPEYLDSSMVACFKSCPFKFYLEYILNFKPRSNSVHLVAGGAYAKGLEVARKAFFTGERWHPEVQTDDNGERHLGWRVEQGEPASQDEAEGLGLAALLATYGDFECPPDSAKSAERTAGALEFYFDQYPLGRCGANPLIMAGGQAAIEYTFAEPIEVSHPITGAPLLYCGGSDMLASYSGQDFVEDDKTTSQLGPTWSKQWDLRSQFTGYCWGHSKAQNRKFSGVLVRGVSILKTRYDTQQAITYRHPWQIDQWYEVLLHTAQEMLVYWDRSWWKQNLDHACSEYGGCTFRQVCLSENKEPWLNQYFDRRKWNPLVRSEVPV